MKMGFGHPHISSLFWYLYLLKVKPQNEQQASCTLPQVRSADMGTVHKRVISFVFCANMAKGRWSCKDILGSLGLLYLFSLCTSDGLPWHLSGMAFWYLFVCLLFHCPLTMIISSQSTAGNLNTLIASMCCGIHACMLEMSCMFDLHQISIPKVFI